MSFFLTLLLSSLAFAAPAPSKEAGTKDRRQVVVVLGGPVIATEAAEKAKAKSTKAKSKKARGKAGWVPVLADCLDEHQTNRFAVVDMTDSVSSLQAVNDRVAKVVDQRPDWIILTVGAPEFAASLGKPANDAKAFTDQVGKVVDQFEAEKSRARLVLMGIHAGPDDLAAKNEQLIDRLRQWNQSMAAFAAKRDRVSFAPLRWPTDRKSMEVLRDDSGGLSDPGDVYVATVACDAVFSALGGKAPSK